MVVTTDVTACVKLLAKADKRKGTILLVHGSDGRQPAMLRWGAFIAELGFDALVMDSFTSRGYKHRQDVGWDQAVAHQVSDIKDMMAALSDNQISQQAPLFLMGFSMGGYSILKLIAEHLSGLENFTQLAGGILFYPRCEDFVGKKLMDNMLFIMGDQDHRAPFQACERMLAASTAQSECELVVLEGASHGFDVSEFKQPYIMTDEHGAQHVFKYHAEHHVRAKKLVREFLLSHCE